MKITADFECGAAKRLEQIEEDHWRLDVSGDPSGYDKYFCVRVAAEADEPATVLRLDVYPDADLGERGAQFFSSHFPSNIWHCGEDWNSWCPLRNTWEDAVTFHDGWFELRVPVAPGAVLHIATNPPLRHSDMVAWADSVGEKHGTRLQRESLGKSVEGREIPLLRLPGSKPGLPKLVVMAAQHPSEHGGNWACKGIVEYALSSISDARETTENFDIAVVPMINPDGNVNGLSGSNAEGVNMFGDFAEAAGGCLPQAAESRLLWEWLGSDFTPDVILHFHGYMGWKRFSQPPYDGIYFLEDAEGLYKTAARLAAYRAIQDRMIFETEGYTAVWSAGVLGEDSLEHQLAAKFETLSAFYEINSASVGPFDQFRRGPQVLGAVVRALVRDVSDWK